MQTYNLSQYGIHSRLGFRKCSLTDSADSPELREQRGRPSRGSTGRRLCKPCCSPYPDAPAMWVALQLSEPVLLTPHESSSCEHGHQFTPNDKKKKHNPMLELILSQASMATMKLQFFEEVQCNSQRDDIACCVTVDAYPVTHTRVCSGLPWGQSLGNPPRVFHFLQSIACPPHSQQLSNLVLNSTCCESCGGVIHPVLNQTYRHPKFVHQSPVFSFIHT